MRAMASKCLSTETINDGLTVVENQPWLNVPASDVGAMRAEMKRLEERCQFRAAQSMYPTVHAKNPRYIDIYIPNSPIHEPYKSTFSSCTYNS